jgi:serine protease Do
MKVSAKATLVLGISGAFLTVAFAADSLKIASQRSANPESTNNPALVSFPQEELDTQPLARPSITAMLLAQANGEKPANKGDIPLTANTIADIAQKAAPSIVNIEVKKTEEASGGTFPFFDMMPFGGLNDYHYYYNGRRLKPEAGDLNKLIPKSIKIKRPVTGSGFVVGEDGYVMTNAHVVKNALEIMVTLNDKRSFPAKVLGSDNFSDLAVLKIGASGLPVLPLGTSSNLRPGEFAIAIGSPFGYDHTVTLGIISAIGRTVTDLNGNINFIQTDAAINPGNSGGPLLNLKGEVVGVNTAIKNDAQSIGFSIPVDVARSVAEDLMHNRKVERPWLGIGMSELSEAHNRTLGLPAGTKGVLVEKVYKDSPAEAAHIEPGDIIKRIGESEVLLPRDVQAIVKAHKVGELLKFTVERAGEKSELELKIGAYPDLSETAANEQGGGEKGEPIKIPIKGLIKEPVAPKANPAPTKNGAGKKPAK